MLVYGLRPHTNMRQFTSSRVGIFGMLLVPSSGTLQVLRSGRRSAGPASTARPLWQE